MKKSTKINLIIKKIIIFLLTPIAILIKITSIFFLIRIDRIDTSRIGHFSSYLEIYLCEKKFKKNMPKVPYIDFFYSSRIICNKYLFNLSKEKINIIPAILGELINESLRLSTYYIGGYKKNIIHSSINRDRDINNLLEKYPPFLKFKNSDQIKGIEILQKLGVKKNKEFVILAIRDSSYLETKFPDKNWSYHDFRNAKIETYRKAIMYIIEKGYYVIRIGSIVNQKINILSDKFIDYANSDFQSDFMDIFLAKNCKFCLGTDSGGTLFPLYLFRKPTIITNFPIGIGLMHTYQKKNIIITKRLFDKKTQKLLSMNDMFAKNLGYYTDYKEIKNKHIKIIDNTEQEIYLVTKEMILRLGQDFKQNKDDLKFQQTFWNQWVVNIKSTIDKAEKNSHVIKRDKKQIHGKIYSTIGQDFLRKNIDLIN